MLAPAALVSVTPGVYWLAFGAVITAIGFVLARNLHGGAENLSARWGSTLFTVRAVGGMMLLVGAAFVAGGLYSLIR